MSLLQMSSANYKGLAGCKGKGVTALYGQEQGGGGGELHFVHVGGEVDDGAGRELS
jgi:hypothetical protein